MVEGIIGILGTALIAAFGWAVQLSGRVSSLETENEGLKELIVEKFNGVYQRLDRIERGMNGHLREVDHD